MPEPAHDFPARGVALVLVAAVIFLGIAIGSVWWLFPGAREGREPVPSAFAEPILEIHPVERYRAWYADQRARLDGAEGRTPIAEAMEEVAGRGAAAFEPMVPR